MIKITSKGSFSNTFKLFDRLEEFLHISELDKYGREGVEALSLATPVDTGKTASSWKYDIVREEGQVSIVWSNTNIENGANVAILIQYGHGTKNGGYVVGRDYINPAMRPIFDKIANELWKEVSK